MQVSRVGTSWPTRSSRTRHICIRAEAVAEKTPIHAATRVQLGSSDLMASTCCLGTMTWGVQNTEAEAHQQLSYAWDQGINFLDTAEMYPIPTSEGTQGRTEQYIGSWMKARKREDIILATKVSGYSENSTYLRNPKQTVRLTPAQIEEAVNASLKRLQVEHIDLLQVHWPDRYVALFGNSGYDITKERESIPIEETLRGLENVIKAGKVRYIGVSNETSYGVSEYARLATAAGLPRVHTIQNVYHLVSRTAYETDLAEMCRRHDVSLLVYSPLAGGSLTGKYNQAAEAKGRFNLFPGYMERYNKSLVKTAVAEYSKVAEKYGLTPTQLALAWCKSRWFVASIIIGATTMDQLKENIDAFNFDLTPEAIADVNAVYKTYRDPSLL